MRIFRLLVRITERVQNSPGPRLFPIEEEVTLPEHITAEEACKDREPTLNQAGGEDGCEEQEIKGDDV